MSNQTFANSTVPLYISSQGTNVIQFNENSSPPIGYVNKELLYCMDDHKLYYNGREVSTDLLNHLTFTPVASNPGNNDTIWLNSSDGELYLGSSKIGGDGNVSSNITSFVGELASYVNTTGKLIGKSNLVCQNNTSSSLYLSRFPYSDISNVLAFNNTYIRSNTSGIYPNPAGGDNTCIGAHTGSAMTSGQSNTFIGSKAGQNLTTGTYNTCIGARAGELITQHNNICIGYFPGNAGLKSTIAIGNYCLTTGATEQTIAIGGDCAQVTTSIERSVAIGNGANRVSNVVDNSVSIGLNTGREVDTVLDCVLVGKEAGRGATSLTRFTAIGSDAGTSATTNEDCLYLNNLGAAAETLTTRIGGPTYNQCFINGIRGITTGAADAIPVLIDSNGQLGTVSSSIRFKENILDLSSVLPISQYIDKLRPVAFNYKKQPDVISIGLIAEEVEQFYPGMCIYQNEQLLTVDYTRLPIMLLDVVKDLMVKVKDLNTAVVNETVKDDILNKSHKESLLVIENHERLINELKEEMAMQKKELIKQSVIIEELKAKLRSM